MSREPSVRFMVVLTPTIDAIDGIRALRAVLKFALRRFGLRAVEVREIPSDEAGEALAITPPRR